MNNLFVFVVVFFSAVLAVVVLAVDLLAEVLVAKKVLAELKAADSQAQASSASQDTNGIINQAIQMKNFENQVQVLEQQLAAMQDLLEGIHILEMADPVQEEISVGGEDS